ncbi:EthD domain-containing protein [Lichenicoccus sp.]|uniref:EthD domain-containing protein n=1 Tax=Lichenicoccus sp. TaxID=2781899 RepID=UPI003D0E8D6E
MTAANGLYKVFHTIVPRGGINQPMATRVPFDPAWHSAATLAGLAERSQAFRFYTRTHRTEPHNPAPGGNIRYGYEAVETVAFDTLGGAIAFREAAGTVGMEHLDPTSTWLVTKERVGINGAPKGPRDTGRGIKVITSMKRRPGMNLIEFRRHWDDHVGYVAATQGISRFTTNHVVDDDYEVAEPPVDGFVEVWFRTSEDLQICFSDPLMGGIQQTHNDLFIDRRTFFTIQCVNAEQWVSGRRAEGLREW